MRHKYVPYQYLTAPDDPALGMELDGLSLRFRGENAHLEQAFLDDHTLANLNQVRVAVLFGAALMAVFGLLDVIVVEEQLTTVFLIRYGLLVPGGIAAFAISFTDFFLRHTQLFMTSSATMIGGGLTAIMVLAPATATTMYFAGNMLVIFFAFTFLGLRFLWANLAGWSIVLMYPIADLALNTTQFEILFTNVFFSLSTCILGMFVCYSMEFRARRNFYLRHILHLQNQRIEQARDELELRVIERTREATEAAKSKSDFLANMSHEIRTPMNGVLGMLELLRKTKLEFEQREQLNVAFNSATNLLGIINDVLDLSKIEAGKMQANLEPAVPGQVIEEVCELLKLQGEEKGVPLFTLIHPNAFNSYMLDANRIRQVILNLVGNAIKFTDSGHITIRCKVEAERLELQVQDTGIGIDAENLKKIFEAFNQADNSASRQFGGTGLGLTITKQLTELMGGNLTAESVCNEGSVFSLSLPCSAADFESTDSNTQVDAGQTVQLQLESSLLTESITLLLERLQCEIIEQGKPDVLITDRQDAAMEQGTVLLLGKTDSKRSDVINLEPPITLSQLANALQSDPAKAPTPSEEDDEIVFPDSNVLLVEDNVVNQQVAKAMLEKFGVRTRVVDDGKQALSEISEINFDLILMDCQMPGMDGFETTEEIRLRERTNDLAPSIIVALTANAMEGDRNRCISVGMNDYLAKPINMNGLKDILQRWLQVEAGT